MKITIIGGGISGLAAAYFLGRAAGHEVALLESSDRLGGLIQSEQSGGFTIESGPDSMVAQKPDAIELCKELGLESELICSRPEYRGATVFHRGELFPFVGGLLMRAPVDRYGLAESPLLTAEGRRRVLGEADVPPSKEVDESVAHFFERRFGPEVLDCMVEPLVAGVYGGEAARLSLAATFPYLWAREREYGHVTDDDASMRSPAESPFWSLRRGMQQLTDRLADRVSRSGEVRTRAAVISVRTPSDGSFRIHLADGEELSAEAVILACQAGSAAQMLAAGWPNISKRLAQIEYAPSITAALMFDQPVTRSFNGTGMLVPPSEDSLLFACTWVANKFQHRAPDGSSMIRAFIGGERAKLVADRSDQELVDLVRRELEQMVKVAVAPAGFRVHRWRNALPQYLIGHPRARQNLAEMLSGVSGLYCIGNYWDGVGLSDCVRQARKVTAILAQQPAVGKRAEV